MPQANAPLLCVIGPSANRVNVPLWAESRFHRLFHNRSRGRHGPLQTTLRR